MKTDKEDYGFSEKWSPEIEQYNFTQVPNLLLACQGHLKLADGELVTLIHLLKFWFSHKSKVYPSIATLTKFSHKGYSTIQKRLRVLEEKEFIKRRHTFGTSNTYDLMPCVIKLYEHQKVCPSLPQKRGDYPPKTIGVTPSFSINKEYQERTRPSSKYTENIFANFQFADDGEAKWLP